MLPTHAENTRVCDSVISHVARVPVRLLVDFSLDRLLCKGLMLHHVVEVVGRSSAGKTQASERTRSVVLCWPRDAIELAICRVHADLRSSSLSLLPPSLPLSHPPSLPTSLHLPYPAPLPPPLPPSLPCPSLPPSDATALASPFGCVPTSFASDVYCILMFASPFDCMSISLYPMRISYCYLQARLIMYQHLGIRCCIVYC